MPRYSIKSKIRAKKVVQFTVRNKLIADTDNAVGQCWPYKAKRIIDRRTIEIDPRQSPKDYLDTLIHESLHELFPEKREDVILRSGTSIANLLWRLGYRRT